MAASIDCLYETGLAGTTLAAVAARAKVTIGAVQHHFGSRDDLFVAVMTEINEKLLADQDQGDFTSKSVLERVRVACDHYWSIISGRRYTAALMIMLGTTNDRKLNAKLDLILAQAQSTLDKRWGELFADQKIPGERIVAARHIALATLRGFAVRQLHGRVTGGWQKEREMLVRILTFALTEGSSPGA